MDLGLKPLSEMAIRARIAFLAVALQIRRLGVRPPSIDGQLMMDRAGLCHPSCRSSRRRFEFRDRFQIWQIGHT